MTGPAPTFGQIRAQVAAVRKKAGADARVFGIQSEGRWTGQRIQPYGDDTYEIVQCDSPLTMRVALQEKGRNVTTKVLLTNLPTEQIGTDILVRLARRKFYTIKNWEIVKELFQARSVDPRVADHGWIAEALLELAPREGFAPVPNGVLDAETVWGILLDRQIGLSVANPDLVALLKWSMDDGNVEKYRQASDSFRTEAETWITQSAGPACHAVLSCVLTNQRPDALPIGLALAVVYSDQATGKLDKAAGRIEKYLGEVEIDRRVAGRWSAAATEVVRLHLPEAKVRAAWLQRADEILEAIQADEHAHLSRTSPRGFDQRLARYGRVLAGALDDVASEVPEHVDQAYREVMDHAQADWARGSRRLERVEMSARLLRWLVGRHKRGAPEPASLADAAREHALAGCFVDWARYTLRASEPVRDLSDAYAELLGEVGEIREQQNRRFAQLLRDWTAAGSTGTDPLRVESVLDEVVVPLAAHAPLLVLVIDGMSFAVFRELVEDITRQDWAEIRHESHTPIWPAICAIPSITEVSRASLLCGRLRQGYAADEKVGFSEHPRLLEQCRSGVPPVLFHKDALQGADKGSLTASVVGEIESARRRIVGVVINAVDDNLLKGEQLDIRWTGEEIRVLPSLLYEARAAGRLVVLVSDHGHVLDQRTEQRTGEGGDRWRIDDRVPKDDEIQIAGDRVVLPSDHRLIAPWSENIRYGAKKNGYHGGVSMQEMVVPVAVLSAREDMPEGWVETPVDTPDWWFAPLEEEPAAEARPVVQPAQRRKKPDGLLFDLEAEEEQLPDETARSATLPTGEEVPGWLGQLLQSSVLEEQKKLGGRPLPSDDVLCTMLAALSEQGGKLTTAALAHRMRMPAFRLPGLLAAVQRVLNVEGYPILTKDDVSDTVELNRELLLRQFDLP